MLVVFIFNGITIVVYLLELFCLSFRVEAEMVQHLSAKYCPLLPPPRSTIAAAFSPDGRTVASTQLVSISSLSFKFMESVESMICFVMLLFSKSIMFLFLQWRSYREDY